MGKILDVAYILINIMAYMLVAGLYLLGIKLSPKSISRLSLLYPRVVRRYI